MSMARFSGGHRVARPRRDTLANHDEPRLDFDHVKPEDLRSERLARSRWTSANGRPSETAVHGPF
jgi:hypothetical protein